MFSDPAAFVFGVTISMWVKVRPRVSTVWFDRHVRLFSLIFKSCCSVV